MNSTPECYCKSEIIFNPDMPLDFERNNPYKHIKSESEEKEELKNMNKKKIYRIEILRSECAPHPDDSGYEVYLNGNRADGNDEAYILRHFGVRINDSLRL